VKPDGYGYCLGGQVFYLCDTCGAMVCSTSTTMHTAWHEWLTDSAQARRKQRWAERAKILDQIDRETF
jgi:hypothetical protein